ncbi:MAG TPA: Uma2 family endonuclease [Bryobacteraceae bacterium]|nr:Uma2 family endonuclease [Bryobacteraceae bacterium]
MPSVATRVTPEEYLERERKAEIRSEYRNGEIIAMAASSPAHARIVRNLVSNIPTLQEYLTMDQYKVHVEQWSRQPDEQWLSQEFHDPNAMVRLASVRIELQLADIYRRVNLK